MLSRLAKFAAAPRAYDLIQRLAGDAEVKRRLAPHVITLRANARILDLGGGTGQHDLSSKHRRYVCLDLDEAKLRRFRQIAPDRFAVAANGTACPLRTGSIDAVLCLKVTHHLDDIELDAVLDEIARILKPRGTLILADAVQSNRLTSRLLWRFDRGAHPRAAEAIERALTRRYAVAHRERFKAASFHDFMLWIARVNLLISNAHEP